MSHMQNAILVFCILGGMAVFFIITGIYGLLHFRRREREQTGRTTGVIVGVQKRRKHGGRGATMTYWHPVIRYTAEGREYESEYPVGERLEESVKIGKRVDVLYEPSRPEQYHIAGENADERAGKCCVVGGLLGLVGAAVFAVLAYYS